MAELSEAAVGIASPWSVSTLRVKLLSDSMRLVEPGFAQTLSQRMPCAAVLRRVVESAYRTVVVCEGRWIRIALGRAAFSQMTARVIYNASRARGQNHVTSAAAAAARRALFDTEARDANTIQERAADLDAYGCPAGQIASARNRQRTDRPLQGMRWSLMMDRSRPKPKAATDLEATIAKATTIRTARAWVESEQFQEIAERTQTIAVVTVLLCWSMASGRP